MSMSMSDSTDWVQIIPQVNPLAEDPSGKLIAADAKLAFDDNAAYRQADIFAMKDDSQIDSRSVSSPVSS